jgi:hypothetical protein
MNECLQIRRKESLEEMTEGLREMLAQRDMELESLRNEAEQLRKQREALIKAFDGGSVTTIAPYPRAKA